MFSLGHRGDQPRKGILGVLAVQLHVLLADHAVQRIDAVFLRRNLRVKPRDVRQVLALLDRFRAGIGDFLAQIIKKSHVIFPPFLEILFTYYNTNCALFCQCLLGFSRGEMQLILYGPKLHFDDGHLHHAIACNALHS